jgi:hypothetical protein
VCRRADRADPGNENDDKYEDRIEGGKGSKGNRVFGATAERQLHADGYPREAPGRSVAVRALSKHVGERVEIHGKAVVNGDGKISRESKTKTEVENGKDQEAKSKTEGTIGVFDMPLLGMTSMKTLSSSCN